MNGARHAQTRLAPSQLLRVARAKLRQPMGREACVAGQAKRS